MDFEDYELISTEQDRNEVMNAIKEAAASKIRIDSENELIKDIAANMKEEYGIEPSAFKTVLNIYHKQNKHDVESKHERTLGLYDKLFGESDGDNEPSDD